MDKKITSFTFLLLFIGFICSAQNKLEREHRIKKSQFPKEALQIIVKKNQEFQRLKFYKEVDSTSKTYTAKFKKARLFYEMDFTEKGELSGLGFAIKPVDIPEENFNRINEYLSQNFEKVKIRKMLQAYLPKSKDEEDTVIKNAFQNLMLPDMVYELFVKGKKSGIRVNFEVTFDAKGNFVRSKEALPPNYDRVLY